MSDEIQRGAATIEPYDVVRAGYANLITDMTREQLTHQAFFLHKLAWDRGEELRAANDRADNAEWDAARNRTLINGHQMRYDALVETMQREGAKAEAVERERDALREGFNLMDIDGKRQAIRDERVDGIVKSLCEQHGYGAVMDSAARQWRAKDPAGAFLIGPCVATAQAVVNAHPTEASSPASEEDGCE
jgi:hypothetical protein